MKEKTTNELDEELRGLRTDELDKYYRNNKEYMADGKKAFSYYVKDIIDSKNLEDKAHRIFYKDIYSLAGVSESYGRQVLNMEKHTKNRDLIIRLLIAARFTLDQLNRALKLYGMPALYSKDKRDACIMLAGNRRKYALFEIDDMLEQQGLKKLSAEEK